MPMVERLFALKIVTYATQRKDFVAPDLARILRKAKSLNLSVQDKHYPPIATLKKGRRAAFVNKIRDLGANHGVIVEVCTYIHGVFPESGAVPFGQVELDLDALQAKEDAASPGGEEAIYRFRALVFGDAIIVEKASNTSGTLTLPHVLRAVLRVVLKDTTYPLPHLVNVGSTKLANLVKSKGGVERVVASLLVPKKKPTNKFAKLLSEVRKNISGAEAIQVSWTSKSGDLSADDVDAIYDELEDDSLTGVKIEFPGGSSVTDLRHYREQERYELAADSRNRPYATSVHEALRDYADALRDPDHGGPLTATGGLASGYYLAGSDDEN
ncbi:MAG: hypothetical protein M3Y70_00775 [Pseudomonadota bacterium]|nr:hypothetical protein [Pseudomonadota bacterium]